MQERPTTGADALTSASAHLLALADSLSDRERAALGVLLARAGPNPAQAELGLSAPEAILAPAELAAFHALGSKPSPTPPPSATARSVLTVILKTTRLCNLRCTYCHSWKSGPNQVMRFPVLARTIRSALSQPSVRRVEFVWHGGEATLLPVAFYRKILWLEEQFRQPGQVVANSVQTNGTRLTDEWLAFLHAYGIGVGVSLDGPPQIHDTRRVDILGHPTAARVRDGLDRLRRSGIRDTGVLMVVDEDVVAFGAKRLLEYLLEIGVRGVALLNALPDNTPVGPSLKGTYLPLPRYVDFLRQLFQIWWPEYDGRIRIRELSALLGALQGGPPGICIFAGECFGGYLTVEPTGEVSSCDKYIGDADYTFGSVFASSFAEIQISPKLHAVQKANRLNVDAMSSCRWFATCRGACPHDRYTGLRHVPDFDQGCCGFAPLLEDMASKIESTQERSLALT